MRGLPRWVLVPAILGTLFIVVPVIAMILRVDVAPGPDGTGGFWALITSPTAIAALSLSLRTGLAATALCIVLGTPMALVLARTTFPGQRLVRALVLLPLVLPPVVGGIALLYTFGRRGLIGQHLEVFGIEIAFTTAAVIMAQTFVALPFLVLSLEGTLRTNDSRFEEVAATLGASPSTVLRRVTLPRVLPGLLSGAVLAFARALGEFGATITFAGSLQGITQTLPLEIYLERSSDPDAAIALSLVLVVVAVIITAAVHGPRLLGGPDDAGRRPETADGDVLLAEGDPALADGDVSGRATTSGPPERHPRRGVRRPRRAGASAQGARAQKAGATLHIRATLASRGIDVDLTLEPGKVVAVLGANGAGKSTLLQLVAGLLQPTRTDELRVMVDDVVLTDSTRRTLVPPRRRGVAWLSQRALLFENMTVRDNVAFGLEAQGLRRAEARAQAVDHLARVGAQGLASRRSRQLSGGQAQRVSITRALATDPRVLLLDEPLASLDVGVAQLVRSVLHNAQRDQPRTTLLVTHDLLDVLLLADRVVVLDGGKVVEDGPAREVLTRPRSPFAAQLAGVNLLVGTATSDRALALGAPRAAAAGVAGPRVAGAAEHDVKVAMEPHNDRNLVFGTGAEPGSGAELLVGEPAVAVFLPQAVAVHRALPEGSPRNVFAVEVTSLEPHGQLLRVWGTATLAVHATPGVANAPSRPDDVVRLAADLTPQAVVDLELVPGARVWFAVKAAEVRVYPS